jgi:hypothetical protein
MALSKDPTKRARQLANLAPSVPEKARAGRGNTRQQRHGALNDREVAQRAVEVAEEVWTDNPQLDRRNAPAVIRYATLLARIERVYAWLDKQKDPVFSAPRKGKAHGIFERLERWERAASQEEDRLAISPLTRAKLGLDLAKAADLATAMSEPDPERRRRLMREAGFGEDDE